MLDFIRNSFRTVFTILLWVILATMTVCGGIIGHSLGGKIDFIPGFVFAIIGAVLGMFIGFMTIIVGGGLVTILLNIDRSMGNIEKMMKTALKKE